MSGVEALGAISAVISIVNTCIKIYDGAAKDLKLPEIFQVTERRLPMLVDILTTCKTQLDSKKQALPTDVWKALEETLESCEEKARNLRTIFEKVITKGTDDWYKRYLNAVRKLGKGNKVEELFMAITTDVQLVVNHQAVQSAQPKQRQQLEQILEEIQKLEPSLADDEGTGTNVTNWYGKQNVNLGNGQQFINETMSGTQHFNMGKR